MMALIKSTSITITCFSLFSLILFTSSSSTNQIFDVSVSLQQALQIFHPNTPSVHSLSTTLLSRSSLPFHTHHTSNYTSLTLSRLARDEVRVNSLSTRSRETPVISGLDLGSGEYFARVGFGRPAREFYMAIDTGSDVTWLQCQPCSYCYPQSDPIYNPESSSTYRALPCNSLQCAAVTESTCYMQSCIYELSYGDGSSTIGNFATETVSFGSSGSIPGVAFGCGHDNVGLYSGSAGLLGLGGGYLSLPSQINATSFSYCLVNRDSNSSSTLDFNSAQLADSVSTPLITNPFISTYRYVNLTGINVGGNPVQFPPSLLELGKDGRGGVIVDSGTTVTRLPADVYTAVRDEFRRLTRNLPLAGSFSILDTCYDLSSMSRVRVPTVAFRFAGGKILALQPGNYLIPADGRGIFCLAFAGTARGPSIIGNVQQQGMRVNYDLAKKIIGFSPNKC